MELLVEKRHHTLICKLPMQGPEEVTPKLSYHFVIKDLVHKKEAKKGHYLCQALYLLGVEKWFEK